MKRTTAKAAQKLLLARALAYPGAWEDHPWGDSVVKVGKKIFVFVGVTEGSLHFTVKLPHTGEAALATFPFTAPTGYGLGKAGWVSSTFAPDAEVPVPLLLEWLEESWQAIAPKRQAKSKKPIR